MKRTLFVLFFSLIYSQSGWAQVALNNSRTLFDAFENPSQKSFFTDSSKQFAFNFFFPTISLNASASGSAMKTFNGILFDNLNDTQNLPIDGSKYTHFASNSNVYILSFKWFKRVKYQQEAGFSWQIRNDSWAKISDPTFSIFDSFNRFPNDTYGNLFNNKGYQQSFHQFAFTYRENFTKTIGLGVKLSLLSGIGYSGGKITASSISINRTQNQYTANFAGTFRSTITSENNSSKVFIPNFKNPGIALTASANFKFKKGWFILANVKDFGFIHWNKKDAQVYRMQANVLINQANLSNSDQRLADSLDATFSASKYVNEGFMSPMNSKLEVLVNRDFGFYRPNLFISKNLWFAGGQLTLINNFAFKKHVLSISPSYNLLQYTTLGGQYLYKTPNFEFFIGSDQLSSTTKLIKAGINSDGSGVNGAMSAGFYLGLSAKIGRLMEHPLNANRIPGIEQPKDSKNSFFRKLFGKN